MASAVEAARGIIGPGENACRYGMLPINRVDIGDERFEPALSRLGPGELHQIDLVADVPATERRLPAEALDDRADQQELGLEDLRVGAEDVARLLRRLGVVDEVDARAVVWFARHRPPWHPVRAAHVADKQRRHEQQVMLPGQLEDGSEVLELRFVYRVRLRLEIRP